MAKDQACRSRRHSVGNPVESVFSGRRPAAIHAMQTTLKELASLRELSGLNVHAARAASSF
ncbi:hypothetical protein [Noviherbaspirillum sp.]|jgi:hypothetical protein|uniref:hypothetical protein n=1 Tax=Noviherbaspirillum sp. TaxID=1926288 RepID=UPI0025CD585D|nr:hypothetical protein [Noviherbaspirillum sp.]